MRKLKVIASALAMMTAMGASAFAACEPATAATSAVSANAFTTSFDTSALNEYLASMGIVTNVSSTVYLDKHVILTYWDGVENAQRYQLEFSRSITDWENAYRLSLNDADESHRLKVSSPKGIINLDETTTYYVRIRAQVDGEYKDWSIPTQIKVVEEMPEPLASLEAAISALNNIGR